MIRNYFLVTFRNIARHKGYSAINITGLALGIACCMLIFLYVKDELTYDRYQSKVDRIYRIGSEIDFFGGISNISASSPVEAPAYLENIPEVEDFTRMESAQVIVKKGEEYIDQHQTVFSDPSLFDIFDFETLSGDLSTALNELNRVVITEELAEKYLGTTDAAGQELTIRVKGKMEQYVVGAVIANIPENSSLEIKMVFPWKKFETFHTYRPKPWTSIGFTSFLLLKEGTDAQAILPKFKEVRDTQNPDKDGEFARRVKTILQPLASLHLDTSLSGGVGVKGSSDPTYSYILSGIALLILILACINFANLSVARSLPRAKEIGVRKVLGARKKQLSFQFLLEAFSISLMAFVIGLLIAELLLPFFGRLTEKTFNNNVTSDLGLLAGCFALVMLAAFIAGSYPSFVISRFSVLKSLSGKVKLNGKQYVTKGLVLFQFTIAAVLVVGTIAMNKQIGHMLKVDLGYDDQDLAKIVLTGNEDKGQLLKNIIGQNPSIEKISLTDGYNAGTSVGHKEKTSFSISNSIDEDYLDILGLELIAGRELKSGKDQYIFGEDTLTNVVVNQKFVEELEIEGDPIGALITDGDDDPETATFQYRIVGVVSDYIFSSAKSGIMGMMLLPSDESTKFNEILIKYQPEYLTELKEEMHAAWREIEPYQPMSLEFVDEENRAAYETEKRWKSIITTSTVLAILISCLGLFGLAHLSAQQRAKEVGVRKVLGASVKRLVVMLNLTFSKLVLASLVVSTPIAYYLVNNWLDNFQYRIDLNATVFLIPALITFGIAGATISVQSFKTASANPVDSLRNE
ncbi:hypothetical protein BFP97_04375 [Roseivirga sp. 4D4]|uniref:ABC transporter permease n=1 Tax=Roseivirga sp. 4D4 TaxID=1889784 RepID=UPI0008534EF1|nr:ABC transporter permease [Roseivirga sp. 4D4]OEK00789.1 hypothetical protein BFP97_04375 [Roseivirga sp. 4D4]